MIDGRDKIDFDELIAMHKAIKEKTPWYKRRVRAALDHAIEDFKHWKAERKRADEVFMKYYAKEAAQWPNHSA